jgi:hypothetical protein
MAADRSMDADKTGTGLGVPVLVARVVRWPFWANTSGAPSSSALNLGGSIEMIPNASVHWPHSGGLSERWLGWYRLFYTLALNKLTSHAPEGFIA